MDWKRLGSYKITDSIDTQWRTDLAVDRIKLAAGEKTSGLASFMNSLNRISALLTIVLCVVIIVGILVLYVFKALRWLIVYLFSSVNKEGKSELVNSDPVENEVEFNDLTEDEELELVSLLETEDYQYGIISALEWARFGQLLTKRGFGNENSEATSFLTDFEYLYNDKTEELMTVSFSYTYTDGGEPLPNKDSQFSFYKLTKKEIFELYLLRAEELGVAEESTQWFDAQDQFHILSINGYDLIMEKRPVEQFGFEECVAYLT